MQKLFVAINLSNDAKADLTGIQPATVSGLRNVLPHQMHLTLHFLGTADLRQTSAALKSVVEASFPLTICGTGCFTSATGIRTLWAGILQTEGLVRLHSAVADSLAPQGFLPETRAYNPHITLARCAPEVSDDIVTQFLTQHATFKSSTFHVTEFFLYSSELVADVPNYRGEASFSLDAPNPLTSS